MNNRNHKTKKMNTYKAMYMNRRLLILGMLLGVAPLSIFNFQFSTCQAQTEVSNFVPGATLDGVNYYLPQTALRVTVVAEKQETTPGELNKYAFRYLRLKNVKLSYVIPIPEAWQSWLQGISVWGEARNLFTLTKYTGNDPEFSVGNSVLYQGVDCGNIAQSRSFILGVKINL